ncbi:MAG TPA: hypothetical protein VFW73_01990 [Lacipirellulaceae bacterium]|nr:hypothetical protein [Lacipirellulaceae bacterium]
MSGIAAAIFILTCCIVAMHVFATTLGCRLRDRTDDKLQYRTAQLAHSEAASLEKMKSDRLAAIRSAPRSPWHGHSSTYLPWLPRLVIAGMAFGGLAGAALLCGIIGHRATPAGMVVGAISFAVVSGWFAFLCGNFYGVFRDGFREAMAEQRNDDPRIEQK